MYRCELCNTILQESNKTKHKRTKKHEYCSNLILNRYVIKIVEVIKFKDIYNPYFTAHTRKFDSFTLSFLLGKYDGEHPPTRK